MNRIRNFVRHNWPLLSIVAGLTLGVVILAATSSSWWPALRSWMTAKPAIAAIDNNQQDNHDDHGHEHDDSSSLEVSPEAYRSLNLDTVAVTPQPFQRTVAVTAVVVERPGRSQTEITAPVEGVISRVHVVPGQAVKPGDVLFEVRLTYEELHLAQREFVQTAAEIDAAQRELDRLQTAGQDVVAGRRILEKQNELKKLQAKLNGQRLGLLLHGVEAEHVKMLEDLAAKLITMSLEEMERALDHRHEIKGLAIKAPPYPEDGDHRELAHIYHMESLRVSRGQQVKTGQTLAILSDHCLLYVEGQAFEDDAPRLLAAADAQTRLRVEPLARSTPPAQAEPAAPKETANEAPAAKATAAGPTNETKSKPKANKPLKLKIHYIAEQVDPESRMLPFYMELENELARDVTAGGRRFVSWRYRPGQRMQVMIPATQAWKDKIVLPTAAVVQDGVEAFVFEQNGRYFDRVPVTVLYRGNDKVVLENDGSLIGSVVAIRGAYQMHLAIKNKAGEGGGGHHGHMH